MLAVDSKAQYDETITEMEYRTHAPFTSTTFNNNDEVRIAIQQQDAFTLPSQSYLYVVGSLTKSDGQTEDETLKIVNNGIAHQFEEIRYEIGGVVVDRTKNVGITSTLLKTASLSPNDEIGLQNACWLGTGVTVGVKDFSFCIPMKMLMGFFEDYQRIIINQKQELIILLSSTSKNALFKDGANATFVDYKLQINKIYWKVPHVKVADTIKLPLLRMLEEDRVIEMPFRSWELHEYPTLPQTTRQSWTIKTSAQLEKPRYVILAFQTGRNHNLAKDMSVFDMCSLTDVKLFLNSQYYPYDNLRGDKALMYDMYARFQSSYYGKASYPIMNRSKFDTNPIFVIDCSKQNESLKVGPVDVRLEFEASATFPANTAAYCLIIHDSLVEYSSLTGTVSRVI